MDETQRELDLRLYSRWEIAAAREKTASDTGLIAAIFAGMAADAKWDFWPWTVLAFVVVYGFCVYGRAGESSKALEIYDRRPELPKPFRTEDYHPTIID